MKPYDLIVYIGRFQPFHNGHLSVIRQALEKTDKLLVLVGSSNRARTTRNPFTFEEREDMIWRATQPLLADRGSADIIRRELPDFPYDESGWVEHVQKAVDYQTAHLIQPRVAIIGHQRDHTSSYLKAFPQWDYIAAESSEINATAIRRRYFAFTKSMPKITKENLPETVVNALAEFQTTEAYKNLREDAHVIERYRADWGNGPFLTVDAVLVQSGHVLLVERSGRPSKGSWALPGGFLEPNETLVNGAIRELVEETHLFAGDYEEAKRYLLPHLKTSGVFDDPERSQRARIVTHAFLFMLPDGPLPEVQGMDDAANAKWVPLHQVQVPNLFDDHAAIIRSLIKKV